jgi:hypothetical protein
MDATRDGEPTPERPELPGQTAPALASNPLPAPGVRDHSEHATGRRRRRWIFGLIGVVVLAGAAVAGWFVLQARADEHNAAAPVEAVKTYVDAIARGDATTANDLVDPKTFTDDIDAELLTDEMLDSADERINILEVTRGNTSGETAEITVKFRLMAEKFPDAAEEKDTRNLPREAIDDSVTLRVTRTDTNLFGFETWEVRDPFLVPVTIMAGGAPAETGTFGSESVPVNDLGAQKEPQRVFVYPALYPLRGPDFSQHLEQWPGRQFLEPFDGSRPTEDSGPSPAALIYTPTDKFRGTVSAKIAEHVKTCLTASPFPPTCPSTLEGSENTTVRVTKNPTLSDLLADPTKPYVNGNPMAFTFVATGDVSLTNLVFPDGFDLPLIIIGQATIKPDDSLTITFNPNP